MTSPATNTGSRTIRASRSLEVAGLPTSKELLERIVREPAFLAGEVTTHWLTDLLEEAA